MSRYMVHDLEVENYTTYKRFCNPFDPINFVVARGWKFQGDKQCSWSYHTSAGPENTINIPDDVTLMVGHNIKFDLMYDWRSERMNTFFKRGGRIWDTQYAEYLINGARQEFHMISMDSVCEKYGGRKKIDSVKALWEMGVKTSAIDKDMLIDYLVGTEAEARNSGDIGNTELIFLGQLKRAKELNMLPMILARMDGLLATTEMEYNGLKIDIKEAARRMNILEAELTATEEALEEFIPPLPEGLEFNWNSNAHSSALVFGGTVKFKKTAPYLDEATGELARKQVTEDWPLFEGEPFSKDSPSSDFCNSSGLWEHHGHPQDVFTSGKKKGEGKFRKVKVPGEIKTKIQEFTFEFEGYTTPNKKWATATVDAAGHPVYSTGADVIEELSSRDIPFLKLLSKRQDLDKDLGTYYARYDPKKKIYKGMLTCVQPDTHLIHHSLHHTLTVTTRLSSSDPNLQNIPKEGTSEVKRMFVSRWGQLGRMLELDYKQLEIVVQALLCGDTNLVTDILDGVDFHCKRVAKVKGCTYEEAVYRCKNPEYQHYKEWHEFRNKAKIFSFQRAYGAGAALIAESTGLSIDTVKDLIEAEESMYPGLVKYNQMVELAVQESAEPFRDPIRGNRVFRRGTYQVPTGTIYSFRTYDAPAFLKKKGIDDSFKPTELKNYPVQGCGGEFVQIALGKLWRHFLARGNYDGMALLCNTVHDSVWIDCQLDILPIVYQEAAEVLSGIPQYLEELYGLVSPVPFPVDGEAGVNLYEKSPIKF